MHTIHRHPLLPWAHLRISTDSHHSYRLHTHAEYSLGLVDAGQALFQHGCATEPLDTGHVVLLEPHVWHACNPLSRAVWSYRMLFIDAMWLHTQVGTGPIAFWQHARTDTATRDALLALCEHLQNGEPERFRTTLHTLLTQPEVSHPVPPPAQLPNPALAPIEHAVAQMNRLPQAPLTVAALAHEAGLSVSHFIRVFKARTGVTPATYRLNARLQGARLLLAQGAPLCEAALAMGFADQAHLQRSFKAHHAMTPGQYAPSARP